MASQARFRRAFLAQRRESVPESTRPQEGVTTAELERAYDEWHDAREQSILQEAATDPWHLATIRHLPDVHGKRVLEIGCGRGLFATELAARGASLVAADFSPAAVAYASKRLAGRGQTVVADIQALPFDDENFDVVVSQETLEHVPSPERALAELVRVTRHGGTLIVTGPNYLNAVGLYRIMLRISGRRYREEGQPLNQPLVLARQVQRLRRLGCEIRAVEGQGVPFPLPTGRWGYIPARPQRLLRWLARNTVIVAVRP